MSEQTLQPTAEVLGRLIRNELTDDEREQLPNAPEKADAAPDVQESAPETAPDPATEPEPAAENDAAAVDQADDQGDEELLEQLQVKDLADRVGMKAADLYDQLQVPLPDGRGSVSLDELKGAYLETAAREDQRAEFELERETFADDRNRRELQDIRLQRELASVMQFVQELPPELVEQGQAAHAETMAREQELLYRALPELRDPVKFDQLRQTQIETAREYGFTRGEVDSISDHRLIVLLRDLSELKRDKAENLKRLREAREAQAAIPKRSTNRRANGAAAQRKTRAKAAQTDSDKARAVAQLLNRG
jgi:hypothetical protein